MQLPTFFKKRSSICFCSVFAIMAAVIITGCTTVHKDFKPFSPAQESRGKTPAKVVIFLPEDLCSLFYDNNNLTAFKIGPVVCENARIAARAAFPDRVFFKSESNVKPAEADFIGILRARNVWAYIIKKKIPASTITGVSLYWEVRSGDGQRLFGATIYGDGVDQRTFGMSDVRYEYSMQKCMDDLAGNLYAQMEAVPQRAAKNLAASNRILGVVEGFRTGITTYAQYRNKKDEDWHVFALQDRAKFENVDYSYSIDPEEDRHTSSVGSWTTKWPRRLPPIDSLRPSVYLPESKIDHIKIKTVYIKELVGSVYDDHPLCELVFEGNDFNTLILTQRSCQRDYLATGKYMSVDAYQNQTLSRTAQQWVNLRPGMSEREVGELIGPPPGRTFSTLTNAWVYEYGYGRLRFNDKGLSNWQMD